MEVRDQGVSEGNINHFPDYQKRSDLEYTPSRHMPSCMQNLVQARENFIWPKNNTCFLSIPRVFFHLL